jgi:hypothetical protein
MVKSKQQIVKSKTTNGEIIVPFYPGFVERVAASSCGLPVAAFPFFMWRLAVPVKRRL